ncbi:MAG: biotin transporter BioY [Ruminococcus sp.]|nr:biotin transporter BioY [Ruminococcus sp.]
MTATVPTPTRRKTAMLCICAVFTALTAVGAFIKVPIPVVPFTLQYLFTMLAGLLLGGKYGAASVGAYVVLGLIGLPIFAEGGGIYYVLKPSFGYLIGFIIGAYVTGRIAHKTNNPSLPRLLAANFAGLGIVYLAGMIYYYFCANFWIAGNGISLKALFVYCFALAVPGDIVLCILAAFLGKRLVPLTAKFGEK